MKKFEVNEIRLEPPQVRFKESYLVAMAEFQTGAERTAWVYLGQDEPHDTPLRNFDEYVLRLRSAQTEALPNFVENTCYWAIYRDELIGRIAIRHELNDYLRRIGGHIGFIVRPSFRQMGVASEMLRQILQTDRARAIKKILITRDEDNLASEKAIIKNGGVFEGIVANGENPKKKRFWINLPENRNG